MAGHRKFTKAEAAERHRVKNRERMRRVRAVDEKPTVTHPPSKIMEAIQRITAKRKLPRVILPDQVRREIAKEEERLAEGI
jgi:hypothetical protein